MQTFQIKKILVLGAGTMGRQIALQCALFNYSVTLYDISTENLTRSRNLIDSYLRGMPIDPCRPHLVLKTTHSEEILRRITFTLDTKKASENVDILIESVPEQVELKQEILAIFHQLCPHRTIFTSNTSSILPSRLVAASGRADKFAVLHFHPVVSFCHLVDLMPTADTSTTTLQLLETFIESIGQTGHIFPAESPKYVFNSLVSAWLQQALHLYVEGIATPEEIDRDWMIVTEMKYGPFAYFDMVGLDVVRDVINASPELTAEEKQRRCSVFNRHIKKGWLGAKSGRGFYTYPNPSYLTKEFIAPAR